MKCIKCGWNNPPKTLKCQECKTILPQVDNLSESDTLGSLYVSDEVSGSNIPRGEFTPLRKVEKAMSLLISASITPVEFKSVLEDALEPLRTMMKQISSMEPKQRDTASRSMTIVEETCVEFEEAMAEIAQGVDGDDDVLLEKGFKKARISVESFKKALLMGMEETGDTRQ